MARVQHQKPTPDHIGIDDPIPAGHALTIQEERIANIGSSHSEERDLVNQMVGQIGMATAISKFTTVVGLSKLQYIKENKLYRALSGTNALDRNGERIPTVGTWDGFCRAIGTSANKVDEDLLNLRVFGQDAMESLTLLGMGYRELRQYRKLPEDQKDALAAVAKTGDKDAFLDLAEEIMARNQRKDEQLSELEANYQAQSKVLENKNRIIDDQDKTIHKLTRRVEIASPDEIASDLRKEASEHAFTAEAAILGALRPAFAALTEHGRENEVSHEEFMVGLLSQIALAIATMRGEFNIKLIADGNPVPAWMRSDADEQIEKAFESIKVPEFVTGK
ncbi:hypothetical protein EBAPG3_010395 [Nitrosospira lacus]|uniref:DUF3102 domain-containing protein n=1 Tax=Nitrosospira lacus TaxID=1288494 RepID=A0A1W6SQT8_9PROT|nr:hypothetical protein [Nitrosospira lacus]ARO88151.1 hypothetical protein EBAPG3_010395 [Nitrosospira lacus]